MTAHILIVEEKNLWRCCCVIIWKAEGYEVDVLRARRCRLRLRESPPDLAVIDWMLPGLSGIELIRRVRGVRKPACCQYHADGTRRGSERVRGLSTGGDDYIVKRSRIPSCSRAYGRCCDARGERVAEGAERGDIELDREKKRVSHRDARLALVQTEFRLLEFPDAEPGRVFSREQLLDGVGAAMSTSTSHPWMCTWVACARP